MIHPLILSGPIKVSSLLKSIVEVCTIDKNESLETDDVLVNVHQIVNCNLSSFWESALREDMLQFTLWCLMVSVPCWWSQRNS
jgi:hypothetical protein